MKRFFAASLIAVILSIAIVRAEEPNPMGIPEELDTKIQTALDNLFNLRFDAALRIFNNLKDDKTDHPMVEFGITCTHWWRLSALVLDTDMEESKEFLRTVEECMKVAKAKIKSGDPTGEGRLVLGGAMGLLGRWQATNRQYVNAYFTGKKAYRHLCEALEINPKLSDANLGKGIFDYYVATLPAIVRILAFIGQSSDRNVGLQELEDAAQNSRYANTPAKLFLVDIYANMENNTARSLEILTDLRSQYPFSPFIQTLSAIAYYNSNDVENLAKEADTFMDRVLKGAYPEEFLTEAHFLLGVNAFKNSKFEEAAERFTQAIETKNEKSAFHSWALLYRGYCWDVLNRRDEAVKDYRAVTQLLRRWESWDHANQRMGKPFSVNDEEMKKLKL